MKKRKVMWILVGIGAVALLGSGILTAYFTYTELNTALQEAQMAYGAEQVKTRKLTRKTDELLKAMVQGQARVQALEESRKASEQEKKAFEQEKKASEEERGKLETKGTRLDQALRELQTAFSAEQAKTRELAQKGDELSKAMVQGQARVQALEEIGKASKQEKDKLEAKGEKVETALQELQMAYGAEQAKTRELTHKADELLKAVEQAQEQAERIKGKFMKVEKEFKVKEERPSAGFFQSFYKIFF